MDHPTEAGLDHEALTHLLTRVQDGVVSRRQLLELGASDHDVRRLCRRRELQRVHDGVFVNHTGPLSRVQREWAAVLAHWPAVLTRESALPDAPPLAVVHVAIATSRTVKAIPGVRAHRTAALTTRADWHRSPPRMRLEHAVLDVASARRDDLLAAYRTLAEAIQTRRTSAVRLRETLAGRRLPGKRLLLDLLDDLATGACSVLEHEYLRRVERAHGLPEGVRQHPSRAGGRSSYRDVAYVEHALVVELDGRPFHDTPRARDADADRDLDARVEDGATTVRLTYGLVLGSPCRTAARLAVLLQRGGWAGELRRCDRCGVES